MTVNIRIYLFFLFVICHSSFVGGQVPVGSWREHLSWNTAEIVAVGGNKVYCSNGVGICVYDISSRQLDRFSKVNGLSDAGITAMQYAAASDIVVAGYANGNMDIISGKKIYNIPDIKQSSLYVNKRINHIYVAEKKAYLSCAFGIVLVDLQLRQIRDTYIIGDNGIAAAVFSLTEYHGYFYAVAAHGLKIADSQNRLLTNFSVWEKVDNAPADVVQAVATDRYLYVYDTNNQIFVYDGFRWELLPVAYPADNINRLTVAGNHLLVSASNAVMIYNTTTNMIQNTIQSYNETPVAAYDATSDDDGACWIADHRQGLVRWRAENAISFYLPDGPTSNHATALRFKADRLLVAGGNEIHTFYANQWSSINSPDANNFTDVDVFVNQPETYYVTSWGNGLYVFENGAQKAHYNQHNSALVADDSGNVLCGGLLIDADQKIWVSNNRQASLFNAGQWKTFSWQVASAMGRFTGDHHGQIWTTQNSNGLLVFSKTASEQGQSGACHSFRPNYGTSELNRCNQIANTPDGIIWVATSQGPFYYPQPSAILSGGGTGGIHPQRPSGTYEDRPFPLLGSENILSVAIDGADRKWFGTETAGVFLVNEDNAGEARHFTVDNSPLFSNKIHDIAINDKTGEVFFATEYGIVSYRSDAVSSGEDFGHVYAFPNPVRPEYQGEITITGLIRDADVKITDVAGNLVYQTRTLGGQAVWNGCNRQGRRVATGTYLVFCTNDDGSKTHITKILFVH